MKKMRYRYFIPLLLVLMIAAGCGRQEAAPGPEPNQNLGMQNQTDTMRADEAKAIAEQTEGVNSAYAVVTGPSTVMVGLFLDEGISDEQATQIEEQLAAELPQRLEGVQQVLVTSNPDTAERIREIGRGVQEGRPVSEFADETEDIMERLMPRTGNENR